MQAELHQSSGDDKTEIPEDAILAAVDLGSNSFHLIIVRIEHHEVRPIQTLSEKVQLGAGLKDGVLDQPAIDRGLDCLSRFQQVLDSVGPYRIRIVGTNALRQARNRRSFTVAAEKLLGVPVEVIYGREEARLVYLGVAHSLADDEASRLVVDIGGGSTEFIVGQRFEPTLLDSLQMGCVAFNKQYFSDGSISRKRYRKAYNAARLEISQIRHRYDSSQWQGCVGSSGTLQAIEGILAQNGWSEGGITRAGISQFEETLLGFKCFDDIDIESLSEARKNVILAGVAITAAIFDELKIENMRSSGGALREGVIYDLLGRLSHEDVRERTISALMQRYYCDHDFIDTVLRRARVFYLATRISWKLEHADWELLNWAVRTHEIGMAISHKHANRHGAYLWRNADLPGFSQDEQETLALMVLSHRRKIPLELLAEYSETERAHLIKLIVLLRLSCLFKHVEQLEYLPEFKISAEENTLTLQFPEGWLEQHPLSTQELGQEIDALARAEFSLIVQ